MSLDPRIKQILTIIHLYCNLYFKQREGKFIQAQRPAATSVNFLEPRYDASMIDKRICWPFWCEFRAEKTFFFVNNFFSFLKEVVGKKRKLFFLLLVLQISFVFWKLKGCRIGTIMSAKHSTQFYKHI